MRTKSVLICVVGLLLLSASSLNAEMRKWTRKNGQEFEAEFVKREGPVVTLKKPDGTELTVRMPGLSDDDRKYVNQRKDKTGTQATPKPADDAFPARTWTRTDGVSYEANYVSTESRTTDAGQQIYIVTLKKADGTQLTLRAGMLGKVDRAYLVQILKSQHKPVPAILLKDPATRSAPTTAVAQAVVVVNSNSQATPPSPTAPSKSDQAKPVQPNAQPALSNPVVQPKSPAPEPLVVAAKPQDDVDKGKGTKKSVDSDALQDRIEQMKTAKALLSRIVKGFPANCVTAEVIGTPKPIKEDNQKVTVRVKVKLSVDEKALAAFRKRLLVVLDEFKEEDWDETWKFEPLHEKSTESSKKSLAHADAVYFRVKEKDEKSGGKTVTDEIAVYVNTERNEDWTSLKWKAYALDQMLTEVFDDATGRHGECVLSIFSKAGDTIPLDRFPLDDARLGGTTPIVDRAEYGDGGRTFFISSTFLRDAACKKHAPSVTVVREVEIPASLLDRLQALKCETRYVSGDRRGK